MLTPYQLASNTPINVIDLDGLEIYYTNIGDYLGKIGNDRFVKIVEDNWRPAVAIYIDWTNCSKSPKAYIWNYAIISDRDYTMSRGLTAINYDKIDKFTGNYGNGDISGDITIFEGSLNYEQFTVGNWGNWDDGRILKNYDPGKSFLAPNFDELEKKGMKAEVSFSANLGVGTMTMHNQHGFGIVNHLNQKDYNLSTSGGVYDIRGLSAGVGSGRLENGQLTYRNWYVAFGMGIGADFSFQVPTGGSNWFSTTQIDSVKIAQMNFLEAYPGSLNQIYYDNWLKEKLK